MELTDILSAEQIKIPLEATTKEGAITELVDLLVSRGEIFDREKALAAVLERERTRTTGIGNGLALPHGKASATNKLVMAIGKAATPIDFDSIDQKPVTLVMLLVSPMDQTGPHIQALAHISRLMSNDQFRNKLNAATTPEQVMQLVESQEELQ